MNTFLVTEHDGHCEIAMVSPVQMTRVAGSPLQYDQLKAHMFHWWCMVTASQEKPPLKVQFGRTYKTVWGVCVVCYKDACGISPARVISSDGKCEYSVQDNGKSVNGVFSEDLRFEMP